MRALRLTLACLLLLLPPLGCRVAPRQDGPPDVEQGDHPLVFMEQPVKFCWREPPSPWSGGVQILLDSSGSLVGAKRAVPKIVNWLQHGISQLQTSTLSVTGSRLCQFSEAFSQGRGFGNCADIGKAPPRFEPSGNTNLHTAINSAKDYGLTMILTDGVAATGGGRVGDCASGVDAACVARALRSVVGTPGSQPEKVNWGVWVLPLASNYEGTFYTEEAVAPASFNPSRTQDAVRGETGAQPAVEQPRAGGDGHLEFNYRGPRMMLLIVIARWADLGRDAVEALWERMDAVGIRRAEKMQDLAALSDAVASFPPIEIYPGFSEQVEWRTIEESEEAEGKSGTMDVYFARDRQAVELACPQGETAFGQYRLDGASPQAGRVAGCVDIGVVPPFTFTLQATGQADDLTQFVRSFAQEGDSYAKLRLGLYCDASAPHPCRDNPLVAQWVGLAHYEGAADALAAPDGAHAVVRRIAEISTEHPSAEPHRVFGLADTLEAFYRELSAERQTTVVSELKLCHR
jgi:hypothetical protein